MDAPSTQVDWTAGAVELVTGQVPWPRTGQPRRAGVSSFGISGTNAHVIVEQAPPAGTVPPPAGQETGAGLGTARWPRPPGPLVRGSGGQAGSGGAAGPAAVPALVVVPAPVVAWVVSGKSAGGLAAQAGRLRARVAGDPGLGLADVGWSLAVTRSVFGYRAVVTGGTGRSSWTGWPRCRGVSRRRGW